MKLIAIFGLGNLGRHYMTGLSKINTKSNFYYFDKSSTSINLAKQHWGSLKKNGGDAQFSKNYQEVPKLIDLAIISCTADQRYEVIRNLIKKSNIKYWILEKPISNNIKNLDKINKLLINKKVFINIPKVYSKIYTIIKNKLKNKNITLKVEGEKWNMGSNAIHYIYLFCWISQISINENFRYKFNMTSCFKQKRPGFFDLNGEIIVSTKKKEIINLVSIGSKKKVYKSNTSILISNNKEVWMIDDNSKKLFRNKKLMYQEENFYQSIITKKIVDGLFKKEKIKLPLLKSVYNIQKQLLKVYSKRFKNYEQIT